MTTTAMSIFTYDQHNEYLDNTGEVIWGFTELDMGDDVFGPDDMVQARCTTCEGRIFVAFNDGDDLAPVWAHHYDTGCDHPIPAY